jgi:hypothetical protein
MSIPSNLSALVGHWTGDNRVFMAPTDPVRESATTATVALPAQGRFVTLQYTWSDEGAPQDGLLILGHEPDPNIATAAWIDSWHMGDKLMHLQGSADDAGRLTVRGSYSVPGSPAWGWQIEIAPRGDDSFQLLMHNIDPDGNVYPAVEATYTRQA